MSDESTNEANYEIGYRKPPKATQFKKGESGNPKGRNRVEQIEDVRVVIEDVLEETLKLREDGRVRTVTKLEAMMRAQFVDALRGNPKAVRTIFKLAQKTGLFSRAMLLDRPEEARPLYLQCRGAKVNAEQSGESLILQDFATLRKAKLTHSLMDEIENLFISEWRTL